MKELQEQFEKQTGKYAYIMYAHVAGPTKEFLEWLESLLKDRDELITLQSEMITLLKKISRAEDLPRGYSDLNNKINLLKQIK